MNTPERTTGFLHPAITPRRRLYDAISQVLFERFKAELRAYPLETVRSLLNDQMSRTFQALLDAHAENDPSPSKRFSAIGSLCVTAKGLEALSYAEKPVDESQLASREFDWLAVLRRETAQFVSEAPEARNILMQEVFFKDDPRTKNTLTHWIYASPMHPGTYDDRSFASGVALGYVNFQLEL